MNFLSIETIIGNEYISILKNKYIQKGERDILRKLKILRTIAFKWFETNMELFFVISERRSQGDMGPIR